MTHTTTESTTAHRVVVGYDTSSGAAQAVWEAAHYARARNLGLTILFSLRDLDPTASRTARAVKSDPGYLEALRRDARACLDDIARQVSEKYPELDVTTALLAMNPAGALASASLDAVLVVVGARGKTDERRAPILGGVSTAVIAHAQGPVLVVPESAAPEASGPVVIGLQDAPDALAAATVAITEAEQRGVPLIAIYAWDLAPELGDLGSLARLDPVQTHQDLDGMLADLLAPLLVGHEDVTIERRVVQGSARNALVEASKNASLVVIGSRGLGGFAGLLLGSISRSVTREAACPVMVVRNRELSREIPVPADLI